MSWPLLDASAKSDFPDSSKKNWYRIPLPLVWSFGLFSLTSAILCVFLFSSFFPLALLFLLRFVALYFIGSSTAGFGFALLNDAPNVQASAARGFLCVGWMPLLGICYPAQIAEKTLNRFPISTLSASIASSKVLQDLVSSK